MKILITASPWLGGSGTVGIQLAKELAKEHQVYFLSFDFPERAGGESKNLVFYNFTTFSYALFPYPLYTESLAEKLFDIVKNHDIDIIHAHYSLVFGTSAVLAKRFLQNIGREVPVVVTMHGTDALGFDPSKGEHYNFENLNSFIVQESDQVTVASSYMRDFVASEYAGEGKLAVIPNFIDKSACSGIQPRSFEERDTIVHISNFRKVKRPMAAARVFEKLYHEKEYRKTRFVFIGEGPLEAEVKDHLEERQVPVEFLGKMKEEEIFKWLVVSKAIVLPSEFENFPLVLLEALVMGTPQVAACVGGISDVTEDKETGFLVNPDDRLEDEMVAKIMELEDQELWNYMSNNSLERVKKFDTSEVVPQYLDIYKKAMG